ncbi:hypothetical protein GCM10027037_23800 [Mucilaginibacter koreensis]
MKPIFLLLVSAIFIWVGCKSSTDPDQLINQKASLPQTFKLSELHQKVITTFINNRNHTTCLLYGNNKAYMAASAAPRIEAPGESFTLVTWQQQNDEHWFGARIPGNLVSAETLTLTGKDNAPAYQYQKFSGQDLVKFADTTGNTDRIRYILLQKASITP